MSEIELDAIKSKFIPLEDIAMSFATSIVEHVQYVASVVEQVPYITALGIA